MQLAALPGRAAMAELSKEQRAASRVARRELCHAIWLGEVALTMTHAEIDVRRSKRSLCFLGTSRLPALTDYLSAHMNVVLQYGRAFSKAVREVKRGGYLSVAGVQDGENLT